MLYSEEQHKQGCKASSCTRVRCYCTALREHHHRDGHHTISTVLSPRVFLLRIAADLPSVLPPPPKRCEEGVLGVGLANKVLYCSVLITSDAWRFDVSRVWRSSYRTCLALVTVHSCSWGPGKKLVP